MKTFIQERYDNALLLAIAYIGFCLMIAAYSPYIMGMEYTYDAVAAEVRGLSFFSMIFILAVAVFKVGDVCSSLFGFSVNTVFFLSVMVSSMFLVINYDAVIYDVFIMASMLIVLLIGTSVFFREKYIKIAFIVYTIVSLIVGIQTIIAYGVSFEISDVYLVSHKNSICVNWAVCAVGMMFFCVSGKKGFFSLIYLLLSIIFLMLILMVRGRAAFVAAFLCIVYILIKIFTKFSPSKIIFFIFIGMLIIPALILLVNYFGIGSFIFASFMQGRVGTDLDTISSGRMITMYDNIQYIMNNPLFGSAYSVGNLETGHMYILRVLVMFGLVGGLPFLIPYFYIMKYILNGMMSSHANAKLYIWELGYYLAAILYIVSLFEPAFPLAPKTVTSVVYFMLGISIRGTLMHQSKKNMYGSNVSIG